MVPHHGPNFQPKQGWPWVWILPIQGTWEMQQEKRKGRSRGWKPAPSLFKAVEALNNLNDSGEWNKRWKGELVETNKIFLFFSFFPLHMREGRLQLTMSGVSHWDRKNPPSHSLFARAMAVLLPSSIPCLFCSHMADIICWSILKLFLVSLWHQLQGRGVTRANARCWVALPALPSLVAPQPGTKYGGSLIHQISQLLPKRVRLYLSAFVPGWGEKKSQTKIQRKKKERKRKDQSVNCKTSCGARWKWKQGDQWDNRWGCNWSAFSSSSLE